MSTQRMAVENHRAAHRSAVISNAVRKQGFDYLVRGAYSHSPWRSLFVGSRTTDLLKTSGVATLLPC